MAETPEEADLIARLNKGEERAFETIFHKYYASLCFFANNFLRDKEAAKDIVQDVFVLLYEKKYQFPNLNALKAFLYQCVHDKALNYIEKRRIRSEIESQLDIPLYEENTYFLRQTETEMYEEIFRAIDELPTECRRIFKMSYIERLSIQEISQRLNIADTTIKTQRARAKKFLQERLKDLFSLAILLFF